MKISKLLIFPISLLVLLSACKSSYLMQTFSFTNIDGKAIPLYGKIGVGEKCEDFLHTKGDKNRETSRYFFKEMVEIPENNTSFFISYSSDVSILFLHLYGKEDSIVKKVRISTLAGKKIKYMVPLEKGFFIKGFSLSTTDTEGSLKIMGAGIKKSFTGVILNEGNLIIGGRIRFGFSKLNSRKRWHFYINSLIKNQIAISYEFKPKRTSKTGGGRKDIEITCIGESNEKSFYLIPRPGKHTVYFYKAGCGFFSEYIGIESSLQGFSISSMKIKNISRMDINDPLPADIGTVLNYDQNMWRRKEFEIFSWNLFPGVIVLDTKDYGTQAAMLKRLAFFCEKLGYTGRLMPDSFLKNKHGWNAHDYRTKSLCEFFEKAENENFPLNHKEMLLKRILIKNRLIIRTGGHLTPGSGALISISRSSNKNLRKVFIDHECCHGVFFALPELRKGCFAFWKNLEPLEKKVWKTFLAWGHYNVNDEYLIVNEFLAYFMQQPVESATAYFKYHRAFKNHTDILGKLLRKKPDFFRNTAAGIEKLMYKHGGVTAASMECLIPK